MKTLLHHRFIVALFFAAITVESSAQITITRETFPRLLYDAEGKIALSLPWYASSDQTIGLTLPEQVVPSVYYFQLEGDAVGAPIQDGTLHIVR